MTVSYTWRPVLDDAAKSGGRSRHLRLQSGEVTLIFTTGETLCPDFVACRHEIRAPLSLFQGQKQALKFSHCFRGTRGFHKCPGFPLRRVRKKPTVQLHLLVITCFAQPKLVIDSARTQQGPVQLLDMVRRHYKQNASRRMETVQYIQQPRECDTILGGNILFGAERHRCILSST